MTRELSQIGDSEGQRDLGGMSELSIVTHVCEPELRKWRQGYETSVGHIENQRKKKRCGGLKSTKLLCIGIIHCHLQAFSSVNLTGAWRWQVL